MELKNELGQVMTPKKIARFMVNRVIDLWRKDNPNNSIIDIKILEPSVGKGVFASALFKRLKEEYKKEGIISTPNEISKRNLYFIDIDPNMIKFTRNLVRSVHKVTEGNFIVANTLFYENFDFKFDIVIGNPPYIRYQNLGDIKEDLKRMYTTYMGTADIYIYFYEKAYELLKENGILSYITSNKWTRAKYGKNFREFLLKNTELLSYIDFNGVKVFESATVDTSVIEFKKSKKISKFLYCDVDKDYEINLSDYIYKNGFDYKKEDLSIDSFSFSNTKELKIKKRVEEIGTPLKEWDINIYVGIKSGCNPVFIIDEKTKNKLIEQEENNKKIILPLIRGKDIKKYKYEFKNKYLLYIPWNYDLESNNSIKEYLLDFKNELSKRSGVKNKNYSWFALHRYASGYFNEFLKEKIIYSEIVSAPCFSYDNKMFIPDYTSFVLTGKNIKYILSFLNSKLCTFIFRKFYSGGTLGNNYRYQKEYLQKIPLFSSKNKESFESIVEYITYIKHSLEKSEDTELFSVDKLFERIIDFMVYGLYFEKEMKADGSYINDEVEKVLANTVGDFEKLDDIEKDEIIRKVRDSFKANKKIMKALTFCNVEEIKIIEESVKTNK